MTQSEYLEILFNDVGIDTRAKKYDWISNRIDRPVKFLDELNSAEKSLLINMLKDKKAEKK